MGQPFVRPCVWQGEGSHFRCGGKDFRIANNVTNPNSLRKQRNTPSRWNSRCKEPEGLATKVHGVWVGLLVWQCRDRQVVNAGKAARLRRRADLARNIIR